MDTRSYCSRSQYTVPWIMDISTEVPICISASYMAERGFSAIVTLLTYKEKE